MRHFFIFFSMVFFLLQVAIGNAQTESHSAPVSESALFGKSVDNAAFFDAVKNGQTVVVVEILDKGMSVNAKDRFGHAALAYAALNGDKEMGSFLLGQGADVNYQNRRDGTTALGVAAMKGHEEMVSFLLARGADVDYKDVFGNVPLVAGVMGGDNAVVSQMLDYGADVNAGVNSEGHFMAASVAELAVEMRHPEVALLLLDRGAEMTTGMLLLAAKRGNQALISQLLDRGMDVNAAEDGGTALMIAAWKGNTGLVTFLLDQGADVNYQNSDGMTALQLATEKGRQEVVSLLHDHGATR